MEERIRFVTHKNSKVLLVDLSNCTADEVAQLSRLVPSYVTAEPLGSVLLLADFSGAKFDKAAVASLKEGTVYDRPHLKRSAWVGRKRWPKSFTRISRRSRSVICPPSKPGRKHWNGWCRRFRQHNAVFLRSAEPCETLCARVSEHTLSGATRFG